MIKIRNFDLPEFALLDGDDGKEDYLSGRSVLLHIRSALKNEDSNMKK